MLPADAVAQAAQYNNSMHMPYTAQVLQHLTTLCIRVRDQAQPADITLLFL